MSSQKPTRPGLKYAREVSVGVTVLIVYGVLTAGYKWAVAVAGEIGKELPVPFWLVSLALLFSAYGIVLAVLNAYKAYRETVSSKEKSNLRTPRPLLQREIEVDLRSLAPLTVLKNVQRPEINLWLRLTNLSKRRVVVSHLNVAIWFYQPTVELTARQPLDLKARSTRQDVHLHKLLEDSERDIIFSFFKSDDATRYITIDVDITVTYDNGHLRKGQHFELRSQDVLGVLR